MRLLQERIEINVPEEFVWNLLADFGDVALWAPYMRESHLVGTQSSGVGMRRAMRHSWGFGFEEVVTQWHERTGFAFDVIRAPYPMKDVKEVWAIGSHNGGSVVETQVRYDTNLGLVGAIFDWLVLRFVVRREMRAGLRGLKNYSEALAGQAALLGYAD
jgi:ligand-binding SRPBCC domain-containing protein